MDPLAIDVLIYAALGFAAVASATMLIDVFLGGREKRLRSALAYAYSRIEDLEKRLAEYEALNRELQHKMKSLEQEYSRKLEEEVERVRQEYEKRLREAQRVSRVAMTILEALQKGVLKLVDSKGECRSIIVEPGQILCRVDAKTMKVIYPEERSVGEEVLVQE